MIFRKIIFWAHLTLGLSAGLVIAVLAFTGACMSFQNQIINRAEHDLRRVAPPSTGAERLSLREILQDVREAQPDSPRPSAITIAADPTAALVVNLGRTNSVCVNPYTGEVRGQGARKWREFFQLMLRCHRWLGLSQPQPGGDNGGARRIAGGIMGVACAVLFALCLSGLYLWWPRTWTWRALKSSAFFGRGLRGKARDWNWHNAIGLWCSPVLILITFTGLIMAWHWLGDLIYQRPEGDTVQISTPAPGTRPLGADALLAIAQHEVPAWATITLNLGGQRLRPPQGGQPHSGPPRERPVDGRPGGGEHREGAPPAQAAVISILERGAWSSVPTSLQIEPYTGAVLRHERLSDYDFRRALRALARPLHTGETGGMLGAALKFFAALGALILIYTGFAMAWRRFFRPAHCTGPAGPLKKLPGQRAGQVAN